MIEFLYVKQTIFTILTFKPPHKASQSLFCESKLTKNGAVSSCPPASPSSIPDYSVYSCITGSLILDYGVKCPTSTGIPTNVHTDGKIKFSPTGAYHTRIMLRVSIGSQSSEQGIFYTIYLWNELGDFVFPCIFVTQRAQHLTQEWYSKLLCDCYTSYLLALGELREVERLTSDFDLSTV